MSLITKQSCTVTKVSLRNLNNLKPHQVLKRFLTGHILTEFLRNISPQTQQSQLCNAYEETI